MTYFKNPSCEQHDGSHCRDDQQGHEDRPKHLHIQSRVIRPSAGPVPPLHHQGQAQQTVPIPPTRDILQVGGQRSSKVLNKYDEENKLMLNRKLLL